MHHHRSKLVVFFVLFILAIPVFCADYAEAVKGQVYTGDGAVPNITGGWMLSAVDGQCFTCHVPNSWIGAPDKTSYLMTGHKNMARRAKVNVPLTGPDGLPYDTDSSGNAIFWNIASTAFPLAPVVDIPACSISPSTNNTEAKCAAAGGVWSPVRRPLLFIYDGWINETAAASSFNDPNTSLAAPSSLYGGACTAGAGTITTPSACTTAGGSWINGASYSCARCHTTGYTMDMTVQTTRAPETIYPGITRTGSTQGHVGLDPDNASGCTGSTCGPAVAGSWAVGSGGATLEGIQCERCHDATKHFNGGVSKPVGVDATALCTQCHRQEHTDPYTGTGLGSNIHPTPFTDNDTIPASEPDYGVPAIEVGGHGTYAPEFYGHSTGMEYLNSVHGQFTGNFQQINDVTKYGSVFVKEGTGLLYPGEPVTDPKGGGCTRCHDVHQSTVAAVNAASPIKNKCPDCHFQGSLTSLANIKHPTGTGTPLGDLSDIPAACEKCHMPKPNKGEGLAMHLWRINVDPNYTTFPTQVQWNAGQKTAFTAPMGSYANAVWADIDLACGQCHGGGTDNMSSPAPSAVYMNKTTLAGLAKNMHSSIPVVNFTWSGDKTTSYKVNFNAGGTTCPAGATCNYAWDFGDGSPAGTGVTTSHPYSDATPKTVTLTVDTYGTYYTSATATQTVTPAIVPVPPAASATLSVSGMIATITDTSTDVNNAALTITVTWGDGTSTTIAKTTPSTVISHTYTTNGTYTVSEMVANSFGLSAQGLSARVTVPVKYSVSGSVTRTDGTTPLSGVAIFLKQGTSSKYIGSTNTSGAFTVNNVAGGTYDAVPVKAGYTFTPVTQSVTVGPNATGVNFQSNQ